MVGILSGTVFKLVVLLIGDIQVLLDPFIAVTTSFTAHVRIMLLDKFTLVANVNYRINFHLAKCLLANLFEICGGFDNSYIGVFVISHFHKLMECKL